MASITVTIDGNAIVVDDGNRVSNYTKGTIFANERVNVLSITDINGKELHSGPTSDWTPNSLAGLNALGIYDPPAIAIDTTGLATDTGQSAQLVELQAIKLAVQNTDANTDLLETKLDQIISDVQTNGSTNNANLLNVITELQGIDDNTDQIETLLTNLLGNTSDNATATLQAEISSKLNSTDELSKYNDLFGRPRNIGVKDFQANTSDSAYAMMGIRLRVGATGKVKLSTIQGFVETSDNISLQIIKDPTSVSNPQPFTDNWAKVQTSFGLGGTALLSSIVTGGEIVYDYPRRFTTEVDDRIDIFLEPGSDYYIVCTPHGGNADLFISIHAREFD